MIDTSIYQNLPRIDVNPGESFAGGLQQGASLKGMKLQNQAKEQENKMAQMSAHLQKAQAFGNSLEGLSALSPEQRVQAYPQMRQQMIESGVISPEQAPEGYDEGFYRSSLMRYRQTAPAIDNQLKKAHTAYYNAQAAKEQKNISGKALPAGEASKIGNLLGAVDASSKIESLGGEIPTGKIESAKDWFKSLTGRQDQDRAKSLADIASQRNEVMSRIAGANVTADEKARILEGIPSNIDAPTSFTGKGRSTTDQILGKVDAEIEALAAAGYNVDKLRKNLQLKQENIASNRMSANSRAQKPSKGGLINEAMADTTPKIKIGVVENGYVFLGGDPADKKSWKKAK